MIKSELIERIAQQLTHLPEKRIADAVNYLLDNMTDALVDGQRIEIRGFGSFTLHHRPSRTAHNPKTRAKVITDEKYTPYFKPGKELRERVDASRSTHPLKDED